MKQDYEAAQKHPNIRQDFLNAVDLEDAQEHIKRVEYENEPHTTGIEHKGPTPLMTYYPHIKKGRVVVFPAAFNESYEDFLSNLIDHEGHHARQRVEAQTFWRHVVLYRRPFQKALFELPAIYNQLERHAERGISFRKYVALLSHQVQYAEILKQRPNFKKNLQTILCRSPYDDGIRERFEL